MGGLTLLCFARASYAELDPGTTQSVHEPSTAYTSNLYLPQSVNLENQWAEIWQLCGRKNEHEATKEEDSRVANRLLQLCWLFPTDCLLSHIIVKNVHDLSHLIIKFTQALLCILCICWIGELL